MSKFVHDYAPEIISDGIAHLAVDRGNGIFIPVVQETETHGGTPVWFVESPTDQGKIFPMYLKSLSRKQWVFRCACGKDGCTLEWVLPVKYRGRHPLPDAVANPK